MSAIDPAAPLDTAAASEGDDRMREERQWLLDFLTAYAVRHASPTSANDPGTCTGAFKLPMAVPGTPRVGDMYFGTTGLAYGIVTGPASQLLGVMEKTTKTALRQTAAPTGWTRDAGLTNGSILRYVTGTPSSGGTQDINTALVHTPNGTNVASEAVTATTISTIPSHSLRYLDVVLCTKD